MRKPEMSLMIFAYAQDEICVYDHNVGGMIASMVINSSKL